MHNLARPLIELRNSPIREDRIFYAASIKKLIQIGKRLYALTKKKQTGEDTMRLYGHLKDYVADIDSMKE